jgi:hypothetical protein
LAGISQSWPVVFELPEVMAITSPTDQKNLTVLATDFTMRATVPLLKYPDAADADADGSGSGTAADPDGYLTVVQVDISARPDRADAVADEWSVT